MNLAELFQRGGPVIVVLLGLSVAATSIVLLKFFQFWREQIWDVSFVEGALDLLRSNDSAEALKLLSKSSSPVAVAMIGAISMSPRGDGFSEGVSAEEREISRIASEQIARLESLLRGLGSIAHLSPLLGLLGTVLGMITAFQQLEGSGMNVNPVVLAGGIWEALLTTAFGLAVAIPSMAAYFYFEGEVDRVRRVMKGALDQVLVYSMNSRPHDKVC